MTPFDKHQPSGITIHHSLTKDSSTLTLEAIDRYHKDVNGWDDIGYHYLSEQFGDEVNIFTGRSTAYQGAHALAVNRTHLGVCAVGNFDEDVPSQEIFDALVNCCIGIMVMHPRITPQDINFHSDVSEKTCPGKLFPRTAFLLAVSDRAQQLGLHRG